MTDSPAFAPASVRHADALPPGTRLAEFEVVSLLGVGGFGMVYKAFDHSLHRTVAIKEYMPAALAGRSDGRSLWVRSPSDGPAFQSGLQSFVAEARMLAQFDHPSLVKVFRFWEANRTAYMVMPLYSGMTFKQARAQMRTPPPQAWLEHVLWSVLAALRTLHDSHTLHRDISPDNIFLQDTGPPILLDLGAARHAINDRDHQHTAVLKVNYAPIEQYDSGEGGLQAGPWSDLYSLAAVVHGCLCNDTPLPSTLRSIRDRMVPFARVAKTVKSQFGQAYSHAFVSAIAQALALQPQDRPQDIDAFLSTMGLLAAPAGLESFDFRAALGDIWVEPTDQLGPGAPLPTVDLLQAQARLATPPSAARPASQTAAVATTVLMPPQAVPLVRQPEPVQPHAEGGDTVVMDVGDTVFLEAGDSVVPQDAADGALHAAPAPYPLESSLQRPALSDERASPLPHPSLPQRKPAQRRTGRWAVGAAAMLAVALVLGWTLRPAEAPLSMAQDDIITELAEPAAVVAAGAPVETPGAQGPEPGEQKSDPLAAVVPAFAAVAVTEPPPARAATRRLPKAAPPAPVHEAVTSAPPAPAPAPPPAPRPVLAPQRPAQLCADTNFFTRSACVYRECAKPELAALPMCMEHRRHVQQQKEAQKWSN